ncbi:hypothetical protein CYY_004620, partial [Polysphondylium violaceum]
IIHILLNDALVPRKFNDEYGEIDYWNDRYIKEKDTRIHFDWYHGYSTLKNFLSKFVQKSDSILNIGCGNSKIGEDMNDDSFTNIFNIDYSEPCIEIMKERTKHRVGCEYLTMDGRDMTFEDNSFHAVLDKGTLDAISCFGVEDAKQMCLEVSRILKPGGFFIVLSYGSPDARLPILQNTHYNWTVSVRMGGMTKDTPENQCHYIYIMHKDSNGLIPFPAEEFDVYLNSSIGKLPLEILSK